MLKFSTIFTASAVASQITSYVWGVPFWDASAAAVIVGGGTAFVWALTGKVAEHIANRSNDVLDLVMRKCPVCHAEESVVELTSHDHGMIAGCKVCGQEFDCRYNAAGEPIVLRLGSTKQR